MHRLHYIGGPNPKGSYSATHTGKNPQRPWWAVHDDAKANGGILSDHDVVKKRLLRKAQLRKERQLTPKSSARQLTPKSSLGGSRAGSRAGSFEMWNGEEKTETLHEAPGTS